MRNETIVHIACAADENMLGSALALCHSVARHALGPLHFHLIYSDICDESLDRLSAAIKTFAHPFSTYCSACNFTELVAAKTYPPSIFLRLELFDRLSAARCIYLDADIMVRVDLRDLASTDLDGAVLGATIDEGYFWQERIPYRDQRFDPRHYLKSVLGMQTEIYCNSGVLVIDLEKWRHQGVSHKLVEFCAHDSHLHLPDQDALNSILDGDFTILDPSFNAFCFLEYALSEREKNDRKHILEKLLNPQIVHFTYKSKPWEPMHYPTRFDHEFWYGLEGTLIGNWMKERFERSLAMSSRAIGARRCMYESETERIRRSNILRGPSTMTTWIGVRWIGELMCTLARAMSRGRTDRAPWHFVHLYGAAIIRKSEAKEGLQQR